jgi:hypothetical protein
LDVTLAGLKGRSSVQGGHDGDRFLDVVQRLQRVLGGDLVPMERPV